jgi:hypothetical protein
MQFQKRGDQHICLHKRTETRRVCQWKREFLKQIVTQILEEGVLW